MWSTNDFETPFNRLKQQGAAKNPKEVTLIVIAWEPRGKGEPSLSASALQQLIFGQTDSLAHWLWENSQGRYRLVPHPVYPVIGPFESINDWQFYWRTGPYDPANLAPGDPHYYVDPADPKKTVRYLDDNGFTGGHMHAWAEAIRVAASHEGVNFKTLDRDGDGVLSVDECGVLIVKAQANTDGYFSPVSGSQVPWTPLKVDGTVFDPSGQPLDGVEIGLIAELYAAPPHDSGHLAVAIEEVGHLLLNLGDMYPDGNFLSDNDPGRSGELSIPDAGWRPVHVDAYHKVKWGWLNLQLADQPGKYTLRDVGTTGDALILFNPLVGSSEFFVVENRWRGASYDRYREALWQEGLALWHCIQDTQLADFERQGIRLRRADPRLDANGAVQDNSALFDGCDPARCYDLDDDSQPQNLRFRNGVKSKIKIRNISCAGPVMTLDVEVPDWRRMSWDRIHQTDETTIYPIKVPPICYLPPMWELIVNSERIRDRGQLEEQGEMLSSIDESGPVMDPSAIKQYLETRIEAAQRLVEERKLNPGIAKAAIAHYEQHIRELEERPG